MKEKKLPKYEINNQNKYVYRLKKFQKLKTENSFIQIILQAYRDTDILNF